MSELDKTIEELEAEVSAELEEAKAPGATAGKGDSMEKQEGDVEDLGKPVVDPESKDSAGKKASAKVKKAAEPKAGATKEETEASDDSETESLEEGKMTKAEMLKAMYSEMENMKAGDLKASYDKMMAKEEEEKEEESAKVDESTLEDRLASVDVSEDVSALVNGEEISEEFKEKASTIFEAAVKSKLRSEVERIESAKVQEVAEEVNKVQSELTEKVDAYMGYVVEEWMKENEIAIERGLKGEIAEDFISGLKSLFEEHYIDVPDEKYDILGSQSEKIDGLEAKLNEQIEKSAELKKQNNQLVRESVFAEVSSDLADTEAEKFKSLAEDVDFTDEDSFRSKLDTLKESYFPKATTVAESVDSESESSESYDTTGAMSAYMSAISKNVKRGKV
ncbi:prohead core protein [Methylophilales phage Melnitz EXVC044M]|nr:hypothetical protein Melnitz1EXVC043M_207 [Methylophilales phage Melnitz-1 EXVC043M]QZI94712.1 prohead core protein [Methylophilales phage Melnitz-2 EXVC040M]QZI94934.1 prohead core protein [Methylophilales phage Melnitz EXVC044M]QZI95155.1 prohead core protein [Methylophilales phage Melnitz-3 EXVC039M]